MPKNSKNLRKLLWGLVVLIVLGGVSYYVIKNKPSADVTYVSYYLDASSRRYFSGTGALALSCGVNDTDSDFNLSVTSKRSKEVKITNFTKDKKQSLVGNYNGKRYFLKPRRSWVLKEGTVKISPPRANKDCAIFIKGTFEALVNPTVGKIKVYVRNLNSFTPKQVHTYLDGTDNDGAPALPSPTPPAAAPTEGEGAGSSGVNGGSTSGDVSSGDGAATPSSSETITVTKSNSPYALANGNYSFSCKNGEKTNFEIDTAAPDPIGKTVLLKNNGTTALQYWATTTSTFYYFDFPAGDFGTPYFSELAAADAQGVKYYILPKNGAVKSCSFETVGIESMKVIVKSGTIEAAKE